MQGTYLRFTTDRITVTTGDWNDKLATSSGRHVCIRRQSNQERLAEAGPASLRVPSTIAFYTTDTNGGDPLSRLLDVAPLEHHWKEKERAIFWHRKFVPYFLISHSKIYIHVYIYVGSVSSLFKSNRSWKGEFLVEHHSRVKTFDFSAESHANFYAAIFFADCGHDMEPIKSGWRLVIILNLAWKTSLKDFCTEEIPSFSKALTQFQILEPQQDEEDQRAVPLEHKYSKTNLSFATLKGLIVGWPHYFSTDLLDIHLTVLSEHQQRTDASEGYGQSD